MYSSQQALPMTRVFNRFATIATAYALFCIIAQTAAAALPAKMGDQALPSLAPLVRQASPAVVNIATKGTVQAPQNPLMDDPFFRRFFGVPPQQRKREVRSAGSGVIVDAANGYIITNHHVVENADEIEISLQDHRTLIGEVVGSDAGTDIAIIQIKNPENLVAMPMGNSDVVEVGDFVVAIGNPFGLQHTVTQGIVSALGRTGISRDGYEDFIQTDASINPGNSGGALLNLSGELIGINSAIFSNSGGNIGIGFAIPVNIARSIMSQLVEFGQVRRGLLGVSITDFNTETAKAYGIDGNVEGAFVQEVAPASAAEKAGLEVGDVIVAVDDQTVANAAELRTAIGLRRSGEKVKVSLIRNGKKRSVNATLSEVKTTRQIAAVDVHPGLAGAELSDFNGNSETFNGKGVIIDAIQPGSPAEIRGLQPNDVITAVNRVPVESVKELGEAAEGQGLLILSIRRGNRDLLLQVR
jgi:serine protease Do/serine protease DegQ